MTLAYLKQLFFQAIAPHRPNEWEIEEYLAPLSDLPDEILREIMSQAAVIWPVSQSLCFLFLSQVGESLSCLHPSQLAQWVKASLDIYEEQGLKQAGSFMADVENNYLCRIRGEAGLTFNEAVGRLMLYARGISGRDLVLAPSPATYTDTVTIYLPREITFLSDAKESFLLYKLIVTFQWALTACGTFSDRPLRKHPALCRLAGQDESTTAGMLSLEDFLALFPDERLASDLYHLLAAARAKTWLLNRFRGLMRDCKGVLSKLRRFRPDHGFAGSKEKIVEALKQRLLGPDLKLRLSPTERDCFSRAQKIVESVEKDDADLMTASLDLYRLLESMTGDYTPTSPLAFQGLLKPAEARAARLKKRQKDRQQFVNSLAVVLQSSMAVEIPPSDGAETSEESAAIPADAVALAHLDDGAAEYSEKVDREPLEFIRLGDLKVEIPDNMKPLVRDITEDLGHIPSQYISAAVHMSGKAHSGFTGPAAEECEAQAGPMVYDEWDFRRAGFRKNWCKLLQKELQPVKSAFADATLTNYRGSLVKLKREFEMLRTGERFVKRQREGDDIDFDAVTDSLADSRAGLAPSEKLFIRLQRDERDIAAVFLVDMSSSTEGWVSKALKEALVLMCEALEVLGDRYAIYGFSGMRRLRSELYHIKHFDEPYAAEVKGRICAITPIDYTRMGPPIRHVTKMLAGVEARIRLLITLSDGKPEDYDDYKGDYAVEDTRHALIEAKSIGIHPFCITIDKKAHDYIAHMFGEVNYIFIDNVQKLPLRMPEIYRNLTS